MTLRIFLLLGFLSVALGACSDDDTPSGPSVPTNVIMPLQWANTWVLERTRHEQGSVGIYNDTLTVDPSTEINGESWQPVVLLGSGTKRFFRNTSAGLMIYEKNEESLYLPYPAAVGDSTVANTSEGLVTLFVLSTDEQVVTPAGTFTCHKYFWEEFTGAEYTWYYAPNVGPVKLEMEFSYTSPQYPDGYYLKETSVLLEFYEWLPD